MHYAISNDRAYAAIHFFPPFTDLLHLLTFYILFHSQVKRDVESFLESMRK
jgi:hypothetical protein